MKNKNNFLNLATFNQIHFAGFASNNIETTVKKAVIFFIVVGQRFSEAISSSARNNSNG